MSNRNRKLALKKTGPGPLILMGDSTATGGTEIDGGSVELGHNSSTTGSIAGDVVIATPDTKLVFDRGNAVQFNGSISGDGYVYSYGSGTVMLGGVSTNNSGVVEIGHGTMILGNSAALGNASVRRNTRGQAHILTRKG